MTPYVPLQTHAQLLMPAQLLLLPLPGLSQLLSSQVLLLLLLLLLLVSAAGRALAAAAAVELLAMSSATAPPLRLLHPVVAMACI
jgi:hypothetical protein